MFLLVFTVLCGLAKGQENQPDPWAGWSASTLVSEGNRRLRAGDSDGALKAYERAKTLDPKAAEIPFAEGLAHFKAKRYDEARQAFNKAIAGSDPAVANDARYSLGTCDHAQALEAQDAQEALSHLERAMQEYHQVLSQDSRHKAARDGNLKAASMWKQIKKQMEQQKPPPQQQKGDNQEKKEDEKEQQKENQQNQDSKDQQEQQQQQESDQQEKQDQQQQQQQQSKDQQEQQEQKQSSKEGDSEDSKEQQQIQQEQSQAEEKEQASREQAQRRLREMLQAMQQKKKARPEKVERVPVQPVQKDW